MLDSEPGRADSIDDRPPSGEPADASILQRRDSKPFGRRHRVLVGFQSPSGLGDTPHVESGHTALLGLGGGSDHATVNSTELESILLEAGAARFMALSDPIRLRILDSLTDDRRCVCEIQERVPDVAPNLLSYHLRVLREAGFVGSARRGLWVDYHVTPDADRKVMAALPAGLSILESV